MLPGGAAQVSCPRAARRGSAELAEVRRSHVRLVANLSHAEIQTCACDHLEKMVRGQRIILTNDDGPLDHKSSGPAYVHLANRKFINARMIAEGYARADRGRAYRHRKRFEQYEAEARAARRGLWRGRQI